MKPTATVTMAIVHRHGGNEGGNPKNQAFREGGNAISDGGNEQRIATLPHSVTCCNEFRWSPENWAIPARGDGDISTQKLRHHVTDIDTLRAARNAAINALTKAQSEGATAKEIKRLKKELDEAAKAYLSAAADKLEGWE